MTSEESPQEPQEWIVVCATCDSVFRVHPGRPSCPHCGGAPGIRLFSLSPEPGTEGPTDSSTQAPPPDETGRPPAPPSLAAGEAVEGPPASPDAKVGGVSPAEEPAEQPEGAESD